MDFSAVLTGDLVASTAADMGAVQRSMAILAAAAPEIAHWVPGKLVAFDRYRGDGWQLTVERAPLGLRAALVLMARLRADPLALATRISIGHGAIEKITPFDLSIARGEALTLSGRGLDAMGRTRLLMAHGTGISALHEAVVDLLEQHVRHWTPEQAEAAALALQPDSPTQAAMATALQISPQAVSYRWAGGAVRAIRDTLRVWEQDMDRHA